MENPMPNAQHTQPCECAQPVQELHQPAPQLQPQAAAQMPQAGPAPHHHGKPKPKRRFFRRFICGYLMIVGALVNIFVISQLLLLLLEYLGEHFTMV